MEIFTLLNEAFEYSHWFLHCGYNFLDGFRKVVHVDSGIVKLERDGPVEFQHLYFKQGREDLLEHIKRKVSENFYRSLNTFCWNSPIVCISHRHHSILEFISKTNFSFCYHRRPISSYYQLVYYYSFISGMIFFYRFLPRSLKKIKFAKKICLKL